jgi:hypothetical protein
MLESGDTQSDSRILFVNTSGGQMRLELRHLQPGFAGKGHYCERDFCSFYTQHHCTFNRSFGCFWRLLRGLLDFSRRQPFPPVPRSVRVSS